MIRKSVINVEAAFTCDNIFDLWRNGKQFAAEVKSIPFTDITGLLCEGENNLHIRGYQSDTDERFSSAMTGGIRLTYADGEIEEIVTDDKFEQLQLVGFWETEEPEGFETAVRTDQNQTFLNSLPMHPIALRRSFCFVRQFEISDMPVSANIYSTALGVYEPYMNGERITDRFLYAVLCELSKGISEI